MLNGILTRAALFEPASFNQERNSIDVIFSAGAEVRRRDFEGEFIERLDMSLEAVDLSKLRGAPVLNSHDRWDINSILGTVESAAVDGTRGVATVRFGTRPEIQGIVGDIKGGTIRQVSAGYSVQKWESSTRADGMRVLTAVRWTPMEISFTPLAADPAAQTRSGEKTSMTQSEQYRAIAGAVGVPLPFADDLATRGVSEADARTAIIREAGRLLPQIDTRTDGRVETREGETLVSRLADGLLARINPLHTPQAGRAFAHHRVSDIARECLQARGLSVLGSPSEILVRAMHTTSDFSHVLAEVFNKSLLSLTVAPSPILQIFRRATMADFRARHIMEISDGPGLEKVNEAGEIKFGTITDKELASYKIDSYARGFSISFKALVNDDTGALSDLSAKMTRGARQWFTSFLADIIISNPKLADSIAVFHANHANLAASGAAPSNTTLAAAKLAMRLQVDASGNVIDAPAKYIVIPASLEGTVDTLFATLYPETAAQAEVASRGLTPLVVPQFDVAGAHAWYLFADPAIAPVFEFAELSGYEGPRVETRQGFETLGTELRVVWHLGAGAIDSRGAFKNPGA